MKRKNDNTTQSLVFVCCQLVSENCSNMISWERREEEIHQSENDMKREFWIVLRREQEKLEIVTKRERLVVTSQTDNVFSWISCLSPVCSYEALCTRTRTILHSTTTTIEKEKCWQLSPWDYSSEMGNPSGITVSAWQTDTHQRIDIATFNCVFKNAERTFGEHP